jgi:hypothetical protein
MQIDLKTNSEAAVPSRQPTTAPLIIEFVGIPGAGKSTLCREVIQRLREAGYPADVVRPHFVDLCKVRQKKGAGARLRKGLALGRHFIRNVIYCPRLAAFYLALYLRPELRERYMMGTEAMLTHFQSAASREIAFRSCAKQPGIHLLDEGPCINLMVIKLLHPDRPMNQIFAAFGGRREQGATHLVVFVTCDPTAVIERVRNREGHPRTKAHVEQHSYWWDWLAASLTEVANGMRKLAQANPGVHVLMVQSDAASIVELNTQRIAESITAIWHGAAATLDGRAPARIDSTGA